MVRIDYRTAGKDYCCPELPAPANLMIKSKSGTRQTPPRPVIIPYGICSESGPKAVSLLLRLIILLRDRTVESGTIIAMCS
eukprot:757987-Hanusia_phi.AAC.2